MNEMSFESLMAVGTGLASPESKESKINGVPFDGYNDGVDMDLARTSEQLHFVDTYDKLQSLHSAEKLKMIKKISTAYNVKTIGNANVANSVESFCNNAMSLEGVDVKAVAAKIKAKFIEIFKKIAEFFKNLITKIVAVRYKGEYANKIKIRLEEAHLFANAVISTVSSLGENIDDEQKQMLQLEQQDLDLERKCLLEQLKFLNLALKVSKKSGDVDKKSNIDAVIDSDLVIKNLPKQNFIDASFIESAYKDSKKLERKALREKILKIIKKQLKGDADVKLFKDNIEYDKKVLAAFEKANAKMAQTLKDTKPAAPAADNKDKADKK